MPFVWKIIAAALGFTVVSTGGLLIYTLNQGDSPAKKITQAISPPGQPSQAGTQSSSSSGECGEAGLASWDDPCTKAVLYGGPGHGQGTFPLSVFDQACVDRQLRKVFPTPRDVVGVNNEQVDERTNITDFCVRTSPQYDPTRP